MLNAAPSKPVTSIATNHQIGFLCRLVFLRLQNTRRLMVRACSEKTIDFSRLVAFVTELT